MTIIKQWVEIKSLKEECECDVCNKRYIQNSIHGIKRRNGKIANGKDLCKECTREEGNKQLVKNGTAALKRIPHEQRLLNSSNAGKASALVPNSGRFSKERWAHVSKEDRTKHSKRASLGLQKKLQDPEFAEAHWKKIHAQKKIGYVSVAHGEIHSVLEPYGFKMHGNILRMQVDEIHVELKIVVEYNGDYWHCNPRTWMPEDYNKSIKMTAREKWNKDRARNFMLRKAGYHVIIIWESEWKHDKQSVISKILKVYNEISDKERDTTTNLL